MTHAPKLGSASRRLLTTMGVFALFACGASGQAPPPPAPAQPAIRPSIVFPDGAFPTGAPSAPPANPDDAVPPDPRSYSPRLQSPVSDYAPAGFSARDGQDAPGAASAYEPGASLLPDYIYGSAYYNQPGIGARALADYAPVGYEEREFQDAPGAPEYTRLTAPVPVTPEERQKFVTRGIFPGSFLVPGTNTSFRLRGFVRMTGLYDFDPIGSRDDFVTNTIPVPQESGQNANVSARFSRFALETWTPTPINEWNVHTFIEGDFFNGPGQAVGGGGNPFRLRFAFADFGYFRIGQQNTVFMDSSAFPSTVDFAGPRGLVNQRRPGARMTIPITDSVFWATGVEQPFSDITTNGQGVGVQNIPDFASHLRFESDFGHFQLSGLGRSIGYRPTDGDTVRQLGWGVSASGNFHPWAILIGSNPVRKDNPTGLERSRVLLQYTLGWGIGRYIQDTAGLGLDGQVDPTTGAFDTIYAAGWSASYEHWFTERWLSNLTYSADQTGSVPGQPGTTYCDAKYLAASLWYIPIRNMSLGIEYVTGERENLDGQRARANRVNALFQYNF